MDIGIWTQVFISSSKPSTDGRISPAKGPLSLMFNYFSRMFCFCPLQAGLFALIFITVVQFFSCQVPTVEGKYLLKDGGWERVALWILYRNGLKRSTYYCFVGIFSCLFAFCFSFVLTCDLFAEFSVLPVLPSMCKCLLWHLKLY